MPTTPNTDQLMNDARCIDKCIPDGEKMSVLISVLYQLLRGGGGGSGFSPFVSAFVPITSTDTQYVFSHGLGRMPYFFQIRIVKSTNDMTHDGYLLGQEVDALCMSNSSLGSIVAVAADATNIFLNCAAPLDGNATTVNLVDQGGGGPYSIAPPADWKLKAVAF